MSIRIDYNNAIDSANTLSKIAQTGEQTISTMKNSISNIDAAWKGVSKDGFCYTCERWTTEMSELIYSLRQISSDIKYIANEYKEKDERLKSML
ncbi:MAG: WXG100 family type VII secretion target [Bacillota bacterium]